MEVAIALIKSGAKLDIEDKEGMTALDWASELELMEIVQILTDAGANREIKHNVQTTQHFRDYLFDSKYLTMHALVSNTSITVQGYLIPFWYI